MGTNLCFSTAIRHRIPIVVSEEGESEVQMTTSTDSESSSETIVGSKRELAERGCAELNPEALFMDGLDDAILGIGNQYSKPPVVVYDETLIIDSLIGQGMSHEEAWEYYGFNIAGAWVGDNTPIIVAGLDSLEML